MTENQQVIVRNNGLLLRPNAAKTLITVGFRRRRIFISSFFLVLLAFTAAAIWLPRTYESEMKILVNGSRLDPAASPGELEAARQQRLTIEDINSEAELLQSHDLLRKTVLATGLQEHQWSLRALLLWQSLPEDVKIERGIRWLSGRLTVEPVKKSNIIAVGFGSAYPELSVKVLNTLSRVYFKKHAELQQSRSQVRLFEQEAERQRKQLLSAEARLIAFPTHVGTVAGQMERDITVQKVREMKVELEQTRAAIGETGEKIQSLEARLPHTRSRITTQVRMADNPELIQQLQGTLLGLQLKRTELLQKYKPSYRLVRDTDEQIAATEKAIVTTQQSPLRDETTDRDPTYDWMRSELAKAHTDLQSLRGREASLVQSILGFEEDARKLNEAGIAQQDLLREIKVSEDNYQLYSRKLEEARVGEALDNNGLSNVQLAQAPSFPVLPKHSVTLLLLFGLAVGLVVSTGTVFLSEYMDHAFHTPEDVNVYLGVPVLAVLPKGELEAGARRRTGEVEQ